MNKLQTINLKGNEYATVPTRLKEFRSTNPRSQIKATPHWHEDGSLDFEVNITVDRKDEYSMTGDGWAHYNANQLKNDKSYEKLCTIATGRALSNVGYLNNGEIASTEELEEFYGYKEEKAEKAKAELVKKLNSAKDLAELQKIFVSIKEPTIQRELVPLKDELKKKLGAKNANN